MKINREILVTIRWLATYSQSLAAPLVRAITSELTVKRMEYASAESEPCIGGILSLSSGARTINAKTNGHGKGGRAPVTRPRFMAYWESPPLEISQGAQSSRNLDRQPLQFLAIRGLGLRRRESSAPLLQRPVEVQSFHKSMESMRRLPESISILTLR